MVKLPKLATYSECMGCMLCAEVCPKQAILIKEDGNGYWMPVIDEKRCVGCRACECKCITMRNGSDKTLLNKSKQPYKGWCSDTDIRKNSASGGIFSAIAISMICKHDAIVFGATLQGNKVFHTAIEKKEELNLLQGSKYIQSNTTGIYHKVKEQLRNGRMVVFSGTPCQVKALRVFLNKDYDNLLTIDLICHGVVSNTIFRRHIEKNKCGEVLAFRDKSLGWGHDVFFKCRKDGVTKVDTDWKHNFFYHAFQIETCTRYSCYYCQFCHQERVSDITIGDYWAAKHSQEYTPLGISTILPNTDKGKSFLDECDNIEKYSANWLSTIKSNPRLFVPRPLFKKFACGRYIGRMYKYLPNTIADGILGVWYSKRNLLFLPWFKYIQHIKQRYEEEYKQRLNKSFGNL